MCSAGRIVPLEWVFLVLCISLFASCTPVNVRTRYYDTTHVVEYHHQKEATVFAMSLVDSSTEEELPEWAIEVRETGQCAVPSTEFYENVTERTFERSDGLFFLEIACVVSSATLGVLFYTGRILPDREPGPDEPPSGSALPREATALSLFGSTFFACGIPLTIGIIQVSDHTHISREPKTITTTIPRPCRKHHEPPKTLTVRWPGSADVRVRRTDSNTYPVPYMGSGTPRLWVKMGGKTWVRVPRAR